MRYGVLIGAMWLAGCVSRVTGGLDEARANEVVAALEGAGIPASKDAEGGGGDAAFSVSVPRADLGRALGLLHEASLPRRADPGIAETYAEPSLVPSASEERARFHAAIAGELAATLERIDGVVDARVHVALPETHALALDAAAPPARASVLLRMRPGASIDESGVRALVAGAIDGLSPDAVAVVRVRAPATASSATRFARIGPFRVAPGSVTGLSIAASISLAMHLLSAGALLALVRRGRARTTGSTLHADTAD